MQSLLWCLFSILTWSVNVVVSPLCQLWPHNFNAELVSAGASHQMVSLSEIKLQIITKSGSFLDQGLSAADHAGRIFCQETSILLNFPPTIHWPAQRINGKFMNAFKYYKITYTKQSFHSLYSFYSYFSLKKSTFCIYMLS